MPQESGFFNAQVIDGEFDRVYLAETFARYFNSFIGNGVFAGISSALQVTQTSTASFEVLVQMGQAWINGYWFALDGEPHTIPLSLPDGVRPRIDSIVARHSTVGREITLEVKTGTPAINPVAPPLQRDADAYELQLATIRVPAGATSIRQSYITDTRPISEVCGWVHGVVDQIDTTTLGIQLQTFINEYMQRFDGDYLEFLVWLENLKQLAQQAYQDFLSYLATLRVAADTEFATLINFLLNLQQQGTLRYDEFVDYLNSLRVDAVDRVQMLIDELEALVAGEPIGDLLLRIIALEELQPNTPIGMIEHTLGAYVSCSLYEYQYGAGIGGAGVHGAGGTILTDTAVGYDLHELNGVSIRARAGFGTVDTITQLSPTRWVINFVGSVRSLLLVLNAHDGGESTTLAQRVALLEAMILNTLTTKETTALFGTLDGLETTGTWDESNQRLTI